MNLLDENIPSDQHELLRLWRIPSRVIGQDVGQLWLCKVNHLQTVPWRET